MVCRLIVCFAAALTAYAGIIQDVRGHIGRDDFVAAEKAISEFRKANGDTSEMLAAMSWLGRGALAKKRYDAAEKYAAETKKLAVATLKTRKLDADEHLPIALGAAIEVQAQVMGGRGDRSEAVAYLREELSKYRTTSIRTRLQKNVNLLSLEGKTAPAFAPARQAAVKGKPRLVFLWAHWCGDCKQQIPIIAKIRDEFTPKGLVIIAPTQHYGYADGGRDVGPLEETKHIEKVWGEFYSALPRQSMFIDNENFKNYGASTTPTLVLVNAKGIVTLYHPGKMTYEELRAAVEKTLATAA